MLLFFSRVRCTSIFLALRAVIVPQGLDQTCVLKLWKMIPSSCVRLIASAHTLTATPLSPQPALLTHKHAESYIQKYGVPQTGHLLSLIMEPKVSACVCCQRLRGRGSPACALFFFSSPSAQIAQGYGDQDPGPHAARTQRSAEPGGGHYLFLALSLSVSVPFILFPGWVLAGQAPTKENMENNSVLIYVRISLLTWWIGSMRLKPMRKLFRETNPVEPKQWLSRAEVNRKLCVGEIIGRNKIMKGICQSIGVYFAFKSWIDIAFWLTYLQTVKSGISIVYLRFSWIYFDMTDQSWC